MQNLSASMATAAPTAVDFAALMRRRGKSFYLASLMLPRDVAQRAVALYGFCRLVDDIADGDAALSVKKMQLNGLLVQLNAATRRNNASTRPVSTLPSFTNTFAAAAARDLVHASLRDAQGWRIETQADLLDFCYGVAGTVGVMMCPVLSVAETSATEHPAHTYAANLGIAMQLTNIARDVLEDAAMQRCYLPQTWLQTPTDIHAHLNDGASSANARAQAFKGVLQLISLADEYYSRAEAGFRFIPWRARLAIFVAARVYRAIGVKIQRHAQVAREAADGGAQYWQARTVVSPLGKAMAVLDACGRFGLSLFKFH